MAINLDHTNASNITLKTSNVNSTGCFVLPSVTGVSYLMASGQAPISWISGLQSNLNSITTFVTGSGLNSAVQYASDGTGNYAVGNYSVALGLGAKTLQDYEIAHSAGIPSWAGSLDGYLGYGQSSKIVQKCSTNSTSLTEVGKICVEHGVFESSILFSVDLLGKTSAGGAAAFKLQGSARGIGNGGISLYQNPTLTTYLNTNNYYANVSIINNNYLGVMVSGDSTQMNWISDICILKIKIDD